MARVEFLAGVVEDLRRIADHLDSHAVVHVRERLGDLVSAFDALADNPLIGRTVDGDLRELVIGRDSRGYVALYRHVAALDAVFVLAIRSQREAGYAREA